MFYDWRPARVPHVFVALQPGTKRPVYSAVILVQSGFNSNKIICEDFRIFYCFILVLLNCTK